MVCGWVSLVGQSGSVGGKGARPRSSLVWNSKEEDGVTALFLGGEMLRGVGWPRLESDSNPFSHDFPHSLHLSLSLSLPLAPSLLPRSLYLSLNDNTNSRVRFSACLLHRPVVLSSSPPHSLAPSVVIAPLLLSLLSSSCRLLFSRSLFVASTNPTP